MSIENLLFLIVLHLVTIELTCSIYTFALFLRFLAVIKNTDKSDIKLISQIDTDTDIYYTKFKINIGIERSNIQP